VLTSHGLHYALAVGGIVLAASAAVVTWFERGAGGPIDRFSTALWWVIVTATTVGYGDTYPVTTAGKIVAALIMLVGIALFGLITANVSAYLVRRQEQDDVSVADLYRKLCEVEERLTHLEDAIAGREGTSGSGRMSIETPTDRNG
jgi:voltage-gated potassium channel